MLVLGTYGAGEDFLHPEGRGGGHLHRSAAERQAGIHRRAKDNPSYHPGRCAKREHRRRGRGRDWVRCILWRPRTTASTPTIYCAEIDFTKLFDMQLPDATYTPLPKYPTVSRDLSLVCSEDVTVAQAEAVITAAAGKLLRDVKLFDIYRGPGVPEGKKSMAFSLELRADDRTLTDTDSEAVVTKVLAALKEKLDAALR